MSDLRCENEELESNERNEEEEETPEKPFKCFGVIYDSSCLHLTCLVFSYLDLVRCVGFFIGMTLYLILHWIDAPSNLPEAQEKHHAITFLLVIAVILIIIKMSSSIALVWGLYKFDSQYMWPWMITHFMEAFITTLVCLLLVLMTFYPRESNGYLKYFAYGLIPVILILWFSYGFIYKLCTRLEEAEMGNILEEWQSEYIEAEQDTAV